MVQLAEENLPIGEVSTESLRLGLCGFPLWHFSVGTLIAAELSNIKSHRVAKTAALHCNTVKACFFSKHFGPEVGRLSYRFKMSHGWILRAALLECGRSSYRFPSVVHTGIVQEPEQKR